MMHKKITLQCWPWLIKLFIWIQTPVHTYASECHVSTLCRYAPRADRCYTLNHLQSHSCMGLPSTCKVQDLVSSITSMTWASAASLKALRAFYCQINSVPGCSRLPTTISRLSSVVRSAILRLSVKHRGVELQRTTNIDLPVQTSS